MYYSHRIKETKSARVKKVISNIFYDILNNRRFHYYVRETFVGFAFFFVIFLLLPIFFSIR